MMKLAQLRYSPLAAFFLSFHDYRRLAIYAAKLQLQDQGGVWTWWVDEEKDHSPNQRIVPPATCIQKME